MAIKIRKDAGGSSRPDFHPGKRSGNSGGGGNPLIYFIPMLLKMFGRNPKLLLIVIILGAVFMYFRGCSLFSENSSEGISQFLSTGCSFDQQRYDATEVFEPLADNINAPLPEKVLLDKFAPKRLNQGKQGSCVAWASAYAARTIMHSRETGENPDKSAFSPSFLYNQIKLDGCQGSYLPDAMKNLKNQGVLPLSEFPYDDSSCDNEPRGQELAEAKEFTIDGYNRLTKGGDDYSVDMLAIKQNLAQGAPVVIGMMVGGTFMQEMQGQPAWFPQADDYNMRNFGGHAMCVTGYDDYYEGGAFRIMNSWGEEWGEKGMFWLRYKDFDYFVKEAYGLYPMGEAGSPTGNKNDIQLGIRLNEKGLVPLSLNGQGKFITKEKLKAEEMFKIEFANSLPCYVYVIAEEKNESTTVLFPYTAKHSPYCGITGTRLFPKDYSFYPDQEGTEDRFAVLVSPEPLNYPELNNSFNATSGNLETKIEAVLGNKLILAEDEQGGEKALLRLTQKEGIYAAIISVRK
jgi:hypothetical protein